MTIDVLIIGGGPAGLAAAVNAAAEGLDTVVICDRMGGQAGTSSLIENYMGFPNGISGPSLAKRAHQQATKFGATFLINRKVKNLSHSDGVFTVELQSGSRLRSKTVIIACGAHYNRPVWAIPYERRGGVHYEATPGSVKRLPNKKAVAVIGGGNSAGQAAMYLSQHVQKVYLIVRGDHLSETMSHYLYERVENTPNIDVRYNTNTKELIGATKLECILFEDGSRVCVSDVFVMIGASPNCNFMDDDLCERSERGFLHTTPVFETKTPGLFAVGDIRAASIKRAANAAGEGAACIQRVFQYLADQDAN